MLVGWVVLHYTRDGSGRGGPGARWLPAHALVTGCSLAHLLSDFALGVILGPVPAAITAGQRANRVAVVAAR